MKNGKVHYKSIKMDRAKLVTYYYGGLTKNDFLSDIPKYVDNFDLLELLALLKEAADSNIWPLEIFGPRK